MDSESVPPTEETESRNAEEQGTDSEAIDDSNVESIESIESSENLENSENKEDSRNEEEAEDEESTLSSENNEHSESLGEGKENQDSLEDLKVPESIEETNESANSWHQENRGDAYMDALDSSVNATSVLDVSVLENTTLSVEYPSEGGNLSLTLSGGSAANLGLLENQYITFYFPENMKVDLMDKESDIVNASYNVPILEILGIPLIPGRGTFDSEEILINPVSNSVSLNFSSVLNLSLLSGSSFEFNLTINIEQPLTSPNSELTFRALASSEQLSLIDLNLLNANQLATAEISVPETPSQPLLSSIYSNTTVIRGELPEDYQNGSTVNIFLPGGTQRTAEVSNGTFRLVLEQPLAAGSTIEATITTPEGLESLADSETIQQAPPPLTVPEALNFGTVPIGSDVPYKFLEEPLEIIVQDTRGTNAQWQLQARIDQPLTTETGHTLPNALGFYENGEFKPFTTNASGNEGQAINIKTGRTQNDDPFVFSWSPEQREGPAVKVDHSIVYAEPYSTDIIWTLVDAP